MKTLSPPTPPDSGGGWGVVAQFTATEADNRRQKFQEESEVEQ